MKAALLAALADGAGGDAGRRAVAELARKLGRDAGASARVLAEAASHPDHPDLREAVRAWGAGVARLIAADPEVARAVAEAMDEYTAGSGAAWYDGDHTDFRGGLFLGEVVGVQVVVQQNGAGAPGAMASLPPRPGGFTGRDEETEKLLSALDPAKVPRTPDSVAVLVAAVSGLGGIGKTALAVETAHLARGRGWFPGGVLFVDLHGYDEEPATADQALPSLLRALGVPSEHIPAGAEDREAVYRSVLAERARKRGAVLLLADNASRPDQIRPLLPGDTRHRVLVTSRDRLPQLGARLVPLGQLTPVAAYELLDLTLRIADPDDRRVATDRHGAGRLAALCGYLPLALQIAAALLAEDRDMPVAELVGELAASRDRLDHLDDGDRSVRAAFDLSYRRLPPDQARLLRLLALAPGPEASDEVAAALIGAEVPPLRELKDLARAHLVERGSGRRRWRLHDLVRAYGASVVKGDAGLREEGEAARERVLAYYHRWASAAEQRLEWFPGRPEPERFADYAAAFQWLDEEREGLVAAAQWVREPGCVDTAVSLAERLATYLSRRRYSDDWITIAGAARDAAHRSGNRLAEAGAWESLGSGLRQAGLDEEAVDAHSRACDLFRLVGDAGREVHARNKLGLALQASGRLDEAIDVHTRDLDLFRAAGERRGEGIAWINLGGALREAGRLEEAIDAHTRACDIFRAVGDRHHEGYAWSSLGSALRGMGRVGEAIDSFRKSLEFSGVRGLVRRRYDPGESGRCPRRRSGTR